MAIAASVVMACTWAALSLLICGSGCYTPFLQDTYNIQAPASVKPQPRLGSVLLDGTWWRIFSVWKRREKTSQLDLYTALEKCLY